MRTFEIFTKCPDETAMKSIGYFAGETEYQALSAAWAADLLEHVFLFQNLPDNYERKLVEIKSAE